MEKEHIGQTHVALLAGRGSGGGRWNGLSERASGDEVALLEGVLKLDTVLFWADARFEGFGIRVILGEDFRNPAFELVSFCEVLNKRFDILRRIRNGLRPSDQ